MEHQAEAVAQNLRSAREQRNYSLDQLAQLTGVSKSMLRQIETGKSSPTIATIWKIANGLRVSFTTLLRKQEVEAEVKSFKKNLPLTEISEHYRVFPMISFDPHQSFEAYYLEIDPGTTYAAEPHQGEIYEYIFVTAGTLEVVIQEEVFRIHKDEFLKFDASHPHVYVNRDDEMVTAILQLSYLS